MLFQRHGDLISQYTHHQTEQSRFKPWLVTLQIFVFLAVVTKLSRTSNFIGSCWHEALLFQGQGSLIKLSVNHFLNQSCEKFQRVCWQPVLGQVTILSQQQDPLFTQVYKWVASQLLQALTFIGGDRIAALLFQGQSPLFLLFVLLLNLKGGLQSGETL